MHNLIFVNTVNFMNDLLNSKGNKSMTPKSPEYNQFSERGVYVKEDDQDWGSSGMNDLQKDSE